MHHITFILGLDDGAERIYADIPHIPQLHTDIIFDESPEHERELWTVASVTSIIGGDCDGDIIIRMRLTHTEPEGEETK